MLMEWEPMASKTFDHNHVARDFMAAVNMSVKELEEWLDTPESKAVGWKGADGKARESIGHASGRRIVALLGTPFEELTNDDFAHMRKVINYVKRHTAQQPTNIFTSRWRYSLMNWGHDPLKSL